MTALRLLKSFGILALCALELVNAETWAVLVAGSNQFYNYRHQSDICHSYHILRRNGITKDKIVVMVYDDAATSEDNPVPGTLFNKPTPDGHPGWDVRKHCDIDYSGEDVTAANFLAVLKGDSDATGGKPVLQSTSEDRVFIYFADHGAPGLIAMPAGEPVYAADFLDALRYMSEHEMFSEMAIYLESCESGSMFEGLLPSDAKIWAITAASPSESSWGTYCGEDSNVNGVNIGSCLGDLFSVKWLEDSDLPGSFHTETLEAQFEYIKEATSESHVQKYGDSSLQSVPIDFQGSDGFPSFTSEHEHAEAVARLIMPQRGVNSRDITMHTLQHLHARAVKAKDATKQTVYAQRLAAEMQHRSDADALFAKLVSTVYHSSDVDAYIESQLSMDDARNQLDEIMRMSTPVLTALQEHKAAHRAVIKLCGPYSDYSLKYAGAIAKLVEMGFGSAYVQAAAMAVCNKEGSVTAVA